MSQSNRRLMDSSKPGSLFLRSTSAVSLNERFSQVLVDQQTQPKMVTFDPVLLQQGEACVLLVKREASPLLGLQTRDSSVRLQQRLTRRKRRGRRRRRRSVWARLGWQPVTRHLSASRPKGFWSFRRKYRWRTGFTSAYRRRTQLRLHLPRGGATASRGRGWSKDDVPTKTQLDEQLEEYMSMSKSRLDKELDDYMSMSKSRLDAQLDEYMLMAGQTDLQWD